MERRDIILARVFFNDSNENKVRPAIILSDQRYHADDFVLVSAITTASDDYCLAIQSGKDTNCELDQDSSARFDGIIKLHSKQVVKRIGKVTTQFHESLIGKIIGMIKER